MEREKIKKYSDRYKTLLNVLSKQYDALKLAGSPSNLLDDYSALLRHMRTLTNNEIDRVFAKPLSPRKKSKQPKFQDRNYNFDELSIDDLLKLINNEDTSRTILEQVAVHRFDVPKGSMRSYSNRRMLVDKLLTLVQNEQAHATIELVAKGQS